MVSPIEITVITRVLVAVLLGILIGLQRERRKVAEKIHGVAGLRTHALVCFGAALLSASGSVLYLTNPMFLAASVMTGIGFIGAGSVIAAQGKIKGLVNAATIWIAAAIGLSIGLGLYISAIVVTIATLAILELKRFESID